MAKSFKNLPRPGELATAQKRISEQDFFDLTDELKFENAHAESITATRNTRTGNTSSEPIRRDNSAVAPDGDARQTFVVSRSHLEQLRDYVHARRAEGDYSYSQKQALQEALELLFAAAAPALPRPARIREQEQQRRHRIQQGRRSAASK